MTRAFRSTQTAVACLGIATLLACGGGGGGGSTPTPPKTIADSLNYTNPTRGNYRLTRNSASTSTHLVLDLVGPSSGTAHGIAAIFTIGGSAAVWSKVASSDALHVQNGPFTLGAAPQMLVGKVTGSQLQVGLFQRRTADTAVNLNQTLARIAVDLAPNTPVNTPITLTAAKGSVLLADGTLVDLSLSPNQIAIGTLTAN